SLIYTSTSGSTGEPFYFSRWNRLDWESSIIHELFLENGLRDHDGPTLIIIGFGMGIWVGGLITYKAFEIAIQRGNYPVSIITPGVNKAEIFNALKKLAPHYKQVILTGYAPFVKDIIDEAPRHGIDVKKLNLRLLFAAESFTEKFRDYICKKTAIKNPCLDTLNVYGTADIGTMAYETPVSILIRRLAVKNKNLFREIFSSIHKMPTLTQYNPHFITFESPNKDIILTGNNAVPLIRYSVGDHGATYSFDELAVKLKKFNLDIYKEAKKAGIQKCVYELPFVCVYERKDFGIKLHLWDVYPGFIKDIFIRKPFSAFLTGKFSIALRYDKDANQYLEVNVELKKDKKMNSRLEKLLCKKIVNTLHIKNLKPGQGPGGNYLLKRPNLIKLICWPAEHPLHFKLGIKQKWVKK
nr:hypothetical protein [Candidatus Wolfebacteria bacterium]